MLTLAVDGPAHTLDVDPDVPLLYLLSDHLTQHGPKVGSSLAQCRAGAVSPDSVQVAIRTQT